MTDTGIIILAAGSSSRLGKPKQLLQWKDKTLIEHVVEEAQAASISPVVVITGAEKENVANALSKKTIMIVYNEVWREGMASGIRKGMETALLQPNTVKNIITAVCDQPFVSAELFERLMQKKKETGKGIIACTYTDTTGTPVLFDKKYFAALQTLTGTDGAKKLLKRYTDDVATIVFEKGAIDIDTEEDYQDLQIRQTNS